MPRLSTLEDGAVKQWVIEIFLPLADNAGQRFPPQLFDTERDRLTQKFGGLTIYARAPATGLWAESDGVVKDDIIIFETVTDIFDTAWWRWYKAELEGVFSQDAILIRARETYILTETGRPS